MEELILKEREFKENIVQVINSSNLPAFIIKPILKELFEQVNLLEERQYTDAQARRKEEEEKAKKEAEKEDKHG